MQVEISRLELRYADLRILTADRQGRLAASLLQHGQQTPALVVADGPDRYVLIDGYQRVTALRSLGQDLVDVVVLPIAEAEALVLSFRLQAATRRSSLEEGWLLRELVETHGMTQPMLAVQLRRSKSWVSRRLALVQVLPASAQQAVRNGLVPPQAAMKYLVPLARDNRDHCERLVTGLSGQAVTVREAQRLYAAWRAGDDEQRERIVDHPHLFLKADQAVASTPLERDELDGLLADLEGIAGLCRRARGRLREGVLSRANGSGSDKTGRGWLETRTSFDALVALMEAEGRHASA